MPLFFRIIVLLGSLVILVSFFLFLKIRNKKDLPSYFNFFYCIPLIGLICSFDTVLYMFTKIIGLPTLLGLQNFLSFIEFLLVSMFFYIILRKYRISIFFKLIFVIFLGINCFLLSINNITQPLYQLNAIQNLAISIFCIYYFYKIFIVDYTLKLSGDPTFWIVTGFFISSAVNVPQHAIQGFSFSNLRFATATNLFALINILIIVKYLFFIKAYHCIRKNTTMEISGNL